MDIDLRQFGEIPPATRDVWEAAVARALGSQTLDRLSTITSDGFAVPTLGDPRRDRLPLPARAPGLPWTIVQRVTLADAAGTNAVILDELTNGAGAVDLVFPTHSSAAATAPAERDRLEELERVFEGVYLDMIPVCFTGADDILNIAKLLPEVAERQGRVSTDLRIHAGLDPFTKLLKSLVENTESADRIAGDLAVIAELAALPTGGTVAAARGQLWHALGASESQQVALAISTGIALIDGCSARPGGAALAAEVAARIEFRLVADQNQFLTIAKLRAFRRLWALVLEEYGLPATPAFVHAETAWKMMTRRDPWVNILRATVATAAAAIGGADAITTVPHTALAGVPDSAARRLSRNVQTVLMEESNLHRVGDPAAGAGGIEDLTDKIAEMAWEEVRTIAREGGLEAAIRHGGVRTRIADKERVRREAVARRRIPVTGTSTFPLLEERTIAATGEPSFPAPIAGAERTAEPWERLRDRSDAALAATGARPSVFLANLGPVAAFTARSTWAKNLFEAGGIAAIGRDGVADAEAAAAAFRASGATIACLCSDDATYAALAAPTVAALKAAGATHVLLAGRPKAGEGGFDPGAVDRLVHEGLDMLALIGALHDRLGTPATA